MNVSKVHNASISRTDRHTDIALPAVRFTLFVDSRCEADKIREDPQASTQSDSRPRTHRRFIRLCEIAHPKSSWFIAKAAKMAETPYVYRARCSILIPGFGTETNQGEPRICDYERFLTASQPHNYETQHGTRQWQTSKSNTLPNSYPQNYCSCNSISKTRRFNTANTTVRQSTRSDSPKHLPSL
jgi:hypothetical protein